jgi:hypothetical protein
VARKIELGVAEKPQINDNGKRKLDTAGVIITTTAGAYCAWRVFSKSKKAKIHKRSNTTRADSVAAPAVSVEVSVNFGSQSKPEVPSKFLPPLEAPVFSSLHVGAQTRPLPHLYSLALHCIFVTILCVVQFERDTPVPPVRQDRHYVFRVLQLTPLERSAGYHFDSSPKTSNTKTTAKAAPAKGSEKREIASQPPVKLENGSEQAPFRLPPLPQAKRAEHTLLQPDIPPEFKVREVRVPNVMVWAQKSPATPYIVPRMENAPKFSSAPPVIDFAVPDLNAGNLRITSSPAIKEPALPIPRASTTPVTPPAAETQPAIPETVSRAAKEKSTGRLISVADIALPPEALIAVPPLNQVAAMKNPERTMLAGNKQEAGEGNGDGPATARVGTSTRAVPVAGPAKEAESATTARTPETAGADSGNSQPTPKKTAEGTSTAMSSSRGAAPETPGLTKPASAGAEVPWPSADTSTMTTNGTLTRITRPPTGRHPAVVLGAAPTERYPESAGILTGKIIYTVYLQVGLSKNWIMQYCLSGETERARKVKGSIGALDAPWPFTIVRPVPDRLKGDYTLVRGIVDEKGRFEQLALVIPDEGAKKELLELLGQWEFRPASSDGRPSTVEILLIIPHVRE